MIANGPFARVGRKATVSEIAAIAKAKTLTPVPHTLWQPFLLAKPETEVKAASNQQVLINYKFKPESPPNGQLAGDMTFTFSDSGYINIQYNFLAQGKDEATQTGISFIIPSSLSEFRWVGKGPYPASPGKNRLSEFGIFHLNSNDLYFPGNRQNVSCAVFSDSNGSGFVLVADKANIAVERSAEGIIVSHNSSVSGHFNKYNWPNDLFSFEDKKTIAGNFSIVPFTMATWPKALMAIFGDVRKVAKSFQPFYHSYDQ